MDISADFISSVLFTAADNSSSRTADNNNNNNNNDSSLNNGMLQTTDIQELHLLGLHFDDFDSLPCEQIRTLPPTETNNNHYSYTDNGPSFDSQPFNCPSTYDPKSEISWPGPPSNTDGAIYSFEIVNDNTNSSPFWEEDNLSPITTTLNPSPYQSAATDEHSPSESKDTTSDDYQNKQKVCADSTRNDFESTSLLLRNALLGKTTNSRYSEKSKHDNFTSTYPPPVKPENQNEPRLQEPSSQVYFLKQETATLPSLLHHRSATSTQLDHTSVNMFKADMSDSTDTPYIDEIVLPDFDSFNYTDEQFAGMNQDIAQAIQQICNVDQSFITSYVPAGTNGTADGGGGTSADVVTTNTVDPLIHNQIPPSKARRPSKKSLSRLKSNNSHTSNGDISLSNEFNCTSNVNECNSSNVSSNSGSGCSSSSSATSTTSNGSIVNSSTSANSSSTTNGCSIGIRKERSLHHCFVCNKGFKDKYSVNVHIRTHTGEKPFACNVCSKRFRQKAHLAKHQHTHFQKKPLAPSPPTVIKVASSSMLEPR